MLRDAPIKAYKLAKGFIHLIDDFIFVNESVLQQRDQGDRRELRNRVTSKHAVAHKNKDKS